LAQSIRPASPIDAVAKFRQYIGAASIPVFMAVHVIPAFRSFRLSGHSGFPVVAAFRLFWLSSHFWVILILYSKHFILEKKVSGLGHFPSVP
jgi:hypothetical protein